LTRVGRQFSRTSVAVILVNWNGWRDTVECIDSLMAQDHEDFHVFIVDNDSNDDSIEHIGAWCDKPTASMTWVRHDAVRRWSDHESPPPIPYRLIDRPNTMVSPSAGACRLTFIRSGANRGFAGGCNVAVRAAGLAAFDFFWFLNNDTVVERDALSALLLRAAADPRPGITGSTISYYDAPHIVQAMGGARMDVRSGTSRHIGANAAGADGVPDCDAVEREMDYVMGASMLVSRDFIGEIGLMREDYFLYFEEIDWAIRGRGRFRLAYAPHSRVLHKAQASGKKAVRFSTGFYYRNRIRFTSRFYPQHLARTKRGMFMEMLRHAARGRWTHVRLIAATLREADGLAAEARVSI
jgi:GT2 family glycosyltransferase